MGKAFRYKYFVAALVSSAAFMVYLPSLRNGFVNWDDSQYVTENPFLRSIDLNFFKWAFFDFYASNWHPLTWISHALDYAVWGLDPMGHHLTNNILHAMNTFLVVLLVMRLLESWQAYRPTSSHDSRFALHDLAAEGGPTNGRRFTLIAAATTGLLFGLHPLHVESVAWAAERKDLLCALFYLLSVMMYMSYRSHKTYRTYFLTLGFFVLALLSKPMAVSLPVVLLILDWYPFQRIQSLKTLLAVVIEKLPLIALSLISSALTILAQKTGGATELQPTSISIRLLVAAKSLVIYLWKMIMPVNLIPLYPYPKNVSLLSPEYFLSIVLVAGITVSCVLAARRQRLWLSCWVYYVVTLVPVLGIVQVGFQSMADRYTYMPSLGFCVLTGLAAAWLSDAGAERKRTGIRSIFLGAVGVLVIVSLSYLTVRQIGIWKDSMILWTYVIEKGDARTHFAYNNRGSAYNERGQIDRAVNDFSEAIALNPTYALAYRNRGTAFSNMDLMDKAMDDFNKSVNLEPSAETYYLRGMIFEKRGQSREAAADFERAVAVNPSFGSAYLRLGILYGQSGLIDDAIRYFDKAIDISPNDFLAYNNRGVAYLLIEQYDKALHDLDRTIELNSGYAKAYGDRGNAYLKIGQKELAIRDFQKACSLGDREGCEASQNL